MQDRLREAVGFICRWCLLGLACLVGPFIAWISVVAASAVSTSLSASMIFPDGVCPAGAPRGIHLKGIPGSGLSSLDYPQVICDNGDGRMTLVPKYGTRFYARVVSPLPGLIHLRMIGTPYGCLAFESRQALLLCVPEGRRAYLIDGRCAVDLPPEEAGAPAGAIGEMRRTGEPAFFCPDGLDSFLALRGALLRLCPEVPILCDVPEKKVNVTHNLYVVSGTLGRHDGETLHVVTADAEMALQAAADARFFVHFLGPGRAELAGKPRLRVHESWAKLKVFLAAEPMNK